MTQALANRRILVVEDEYFIASDMKRALRNADAVVIGPTGDLDRGLQLAQDEAIDGAVLDVNLGDATTYPLADELAARGTPFLFVTGYDGWSMPERYRDAPRIAKPFAMPAVLEAVAQIMPAKIT